MSRKVLLVADDDDMNRMIIQRFLRDSFDVLEAEDGQQALDIIKTTHVDALLLDIIMPKMDGLEVLTAIREERKYDYMGVLVATSTKEKTERKALTLGADDIVSKPYDPVVIQKRLENILLMKEDLMQKNMLWNNQMDEFSHTRLAHMVETVSSAVGRLHKMAEIIVQNTDNEQLVAEMAQNIHQEADNLTNEMKDQG